MNAANARAVKSQKRNKTTIKPLKSTLNILCGNGFCKIGSTTFVLTVKKHVYNKYIFVVYLTSENFQRNPYKFRSYKLSKIYII